MQEKKGQEALNNPKVYWSRCFPIKLQLPITIVLMRLIKKKYNNKKQKEEIFNETKV